MPTFALSEGAPYEQLPNPFTPSAWMPQEMATLRLFIIYSTIGSLAALSWDIILHIPDDYKMLRQTDRRINIGLIVYFISRFSSLAYLLALAIIQTNPIGNCVYANRIHNLYPFTMPCTLLLFVFRVCAIYNNDKFVVFIFSLSWLAVLGSSIALPIGLTGMNIGNTPYCGQRQIESYTLAVVFAPLIHDTLVFVATTWKFLYNSHEELNIKNGLKVMFLGRHLPVFSRSVLRDGQAYYLISLIMAIVYNALLLNHKVPRIVPYLLALPSFVVMNNTSCHVYRSVRLGFYRDAPTWRTSAMNRAVFQPTLPSVRQRLEVEVAYNVESDGTNSRPGRKANVTAIGTHGNVGHTGVGSDVIHLKSMEGPESKR